MKFHQMKEKKKKKEENETEFNSHSLFIFFLSKKIRPAFSFHLLLLVEMSLPGQWNCLHVMAMFEI